MANVKDPKAPKVHISSDCLEARISFPVPEGSATNTRYTKQQLMELLAEAGVTFGINQEAVATLAEHPVYARDVIVATGKPLVQSEPGYFEEHFDLTINKKPTIRPDGSTDYRNIKLIEMVHAGDEIVTYHPAKQGTRGINVKGVTLEPKPSRDLPPLAGRGFERSADGLHYFASFDGKIERSDNRLIVSSVYEIDGDVDISMGNVFFNGDIVVRGGVSDGASLRAAGSITIHGLVENCEIYAGKDLFLQSGVKGGEKTIIETSGSITAQFIEYAIVRCKGSIVADYLFKCKVTCDGRIDLRGNKAAIIGGSVSAVQGITVNELGNDFGTATLVAVGVDQERVAEMDALVQKIDTTSNNIKKIKLGLDEFERLGKERGINYKNDPRRLQLLRVKIRDEAIVVEDQNRLDELKSVISHGVNATIKVYRTVYAGTDISIDDHRASVTDDQQQVEFVKSLTGVKMEAIDKVP